MRPLLAFGHSQFLRPRPEGQYSVIGTLALSIQIFEDPKFSGQKWLFILLQLLDIAKEEKDSVGQSLESWQKFP